MGGLITGSRRRKKYSYASSIGCQKMPKWVTCVFPKHLACMSKMSEGELLLLFVFKRSCSRFAMLLRFRLPFSQYAIACNSCGGFVFCLRPGTNTQANRGREWGGLTREPRTGPYEPDDQQRKKTRTSSSDLPRQQRFIPDVRSNQTLPRIKFIRVAC